MATTQNTPSVELVTRSSSDVAQLDELKRILLSNEPVENVVEDDPEAISREIVLQLLSAESDAELEAVGAATGWRELLRVPVQIRGFRWRPSAFQDEEGGSSVFFVVQATRLDTGEAVILTTGSRNALAQLCNMAQRGTLEGAVRMMVQSEKPTARGYHPLWLVTPPEYREAVTAAPAAADAAS